MLWDLLCESSEKTERNSSRARNGIEEYGLSVFRYDFGIRQATDLAMKSAKMAGSYYFLYNFLILLTLGSVRLISDLEDD